MASSRLRVLALLGLGALALHEARFALAALWTEPAQRTGHAHGYLGAVALVVLLVLVAAVAHLLHALLRPRPGDDSRPRGLRRAWPALTLALLAIYAGQETVEGALAGESVFEAVLGGGGWLAAPLALVMGWLGALLLSGAAAVLRLAAGRRPRSRRPLRRKPRPFAVELPRLDPLARHLAGRGPPVPSA